MAQYIDNDMDGKADNAINKQEEKASAHMILLKDESEWLHFKEHEFEGVRRAGKINPDDLQVIYSNLINPERPSGLSGDKFDQTLKYTWYLLANGYANLWPKYFKLDKTSELSKAMEIAKTGPKAWFTPNLERKQVGHFGK